MYFPKPFEKLQVQYYINGYVLPKGDLWVGDEADPVVSVSFKGPQEFDCDYSKTPIYKSKVDPKIHY
jgi:hypothetical protein